MKTCGKCPIATLCIGEQIEHVASLTLFYCGFCGGVFLQPVHSPETRRNLLARTNEVSMNAYSFTTEPKPSTPDDVTVTMSFQPKVLGGPVCHFTDLCDEMRSALIMIHGVNAHCTEEECYQAYNQKLKEDLREVFGKPISEIEI